MSTVTFIPKTHIPVIKNVGFGDSLGLLYPNMDYIADNFIEEDGNVTFTLNDEDGWIGDYQTESNLFFVDYVIDSLVESENYDTALKDFVKSNPFLNGEYLVESE